MAILVLNSNHSYQVNQTSSEIAARIETAVYFIELTVTFSFSGVILSPKGETHFMINAIAFFYDN